MRAAELIYVPYDSGHRDVRMGRGPLWIQAHGAAARLQSAGCEVHEIVVELADPFRPELKSAFELQQLVAHHVTRAAAAGRLPWIIAGNCNTGAIGAVGGIGIQECALLWYDAHDDCETPDTTTSGFFDGMGLAVLTGQCFPELWRKTTGRETAMDGQRIALVGARDISVGARRNLQNAGIENIAVEQIRSQGLAHVRSTVARMHAIGATQLVAHVDLDVHDPDAVAPANAYSVPNGLLAHEVRDSIVAATAHSPLAAASICSFDPSCDVNDRMLRTALELLVHVTTQARIVAR